MNPEEISLVNKCSYRHDGHYLGKHLAFENDNENEGRDDWYDSDQLHYNRGRRHSQKHIYIIS